MFAGCDSAAPTSFIRVPVEYQSSDLFIYTATGSRDTAFEMADPLATALLEHDDVFNDSSVDYGIKDGAIHWWDAVTDYLYNGLPLFFK